MRTLFILMLILLGTACQDRSSTKLGLGPELADFQEFYEQFHQDSLYQVQHITFPLQGIPDNAANNPNYQEGSFRWESSSWKMNKPIDLDEHGFSRKLQAVGDNMIIETLMHSSGQYGLQRRFAKMEEEWMLIYYAGLNPIQSN